MNILITMAGEGKRFRDAGIANPKPMIEARGRSLFEWAVGSLRNFYGHPFFFLSRKGACAPSFIESKARSLGIANFSIQEITHLTRGQAETALFAQSMIADQEDPILIYNIDTYVEPEHIRPEHIHGDGWVPAFLAEGDHWSFVRFDESLRVTDIAEKKKISEYATIGLYYFSSFRIFRSLYERYPFVEAQERYIAPLYALMLQDPALEVYTHRIPKNAVHALGTPEEVKRFDPAWNPSPI